MPARYLFVLFLILFNLKAYGQDQSIVDLFKSDYKKASKAFKKRDYNRAAYYYQRLVRKDSMNSPNLLRLAESYKYLNNSREAERWYQKAINVSPVIEAHHLLHYSEALLANNKLNAARFWLDKYYMQVKDEKKKRKYIIQSGSFDQWIKDSLAFTVNPVTFNSLDADFCPIYYNKGIIFLSSRKHHSFVRNINSLDKSSFLELYYTEPIADDQFTEPVKFHDDLNSSLHEGPLTFYEKGTKVIFSKNVKAESKEGQKKLGLFHAVQSENKKKWTNITQFQFNNPEYNLSHPYYFTHSKTLYFISDMPGGYGGTDIYVSQNIEGSWTTPVNAGPVINTEKNEMFPFVSKDSILYFSSNGHGGMGGIDIFMTDLRADSSTVENLGYPVNSPKDDFSFTHNEAGSDGFFASNRKYGGQNDDIYEVKINRIKVEGIVLDKLKSNGVPDAKVIIRNPNSHKEQIVYSNQRGIYAFYIIPGRNYEIEVQGRGYKPTLADVYSNNPQQQVLRIKQIMEKYNKTFVDGKVMLDGERAGLSTIYIFDPTADTVDMVKSDETGEFTCQINADTTNIILAESKGKLGIYQVMPVKRKRKSSSIQFIEMSLGTVDSIDVKGTFVPKKEAGGDLSNTILILKNDWTNKEQVLPMDANGKFSTKLWDVCKYSVYVMRNEETKFIYSFVPLKEKTLELVE